MLLPKKFSVCVVAAALALIACSLAPTQSSAASIGVTRVTASRNTLHVQGNTGGSRLNLAEIRPYAEFATRTNLGSLSLPEGSTDFSLEIPRFDGKRDRLFSSFVTLNEGSESLGATVGLPRFVERFDNIATYTTAFPTVTSKKGLQVQMVDDAIALGIKHAALNINFTQMIDRSRHTNSFPWDVDGYKIHFHRGYIESLDRQIGPLAEQGIVVSLILLAYQSGDAEINRLLLHPTYDKSAPNRLGAFNTVTEDGARHFRACVEFLADRYSREPRYGGRVANFILGNEVNSHWFWANMGRVSMETFADDYLRTARIANTALRKISSSARLYLSLEHHWNIRYPGGDTQQTFAGRPFLEYFNRRAKAQGDFDWHLAFHPYPENLFEPRTWNDKSATTNDNTPRITFKNLELLPRFLRQPDFLHNGQPRRIILSEQGFHTVNKPDGERWQAAGYAYAYYKTANLPDIDSFILHRHVDHGAEGGLNLGLWTRDTASKSMAEPARKKLIYEVFLKADTDQWREAFEFALPIIGIQRWEELLPQ